MSKAELLSPGNQPALGESQAENVGSGEARDLGVELEIEIVI